MTICLGERVKSSSLERFLEILVLQTPGWKTHLKGQNLPRLQLNSFKKQNFVLMERQFSEILLNLVVLQSAKLVSFILKFADVSESTTIIK